MELVEDSFGTQTSMVYYQKGTPDTFTSLNTTFVYIHGLGLDCNIGLGTNAGPNNGQWLVPDLVGHGRSSKPKGLNPYTMRNQAQTLAKIIHSEELETVVFVAHSMGGLVALHLQELLAEENETMVIGLIYVEGNVDEGDTFLSRKIAHQPYEKFLSDPLGWTKLAKLDKYEEEITGWWRTLRQAGPWTTYASSVDLVRESRPEITLPMFRRMNCPLLFVFGEKNKDRFTSEKVVIQEGYPVTYAPEAGHLVLEDNPAGLWKIAEEFSREHAIY